jgi:hypothetical protein
MIFKNSVRTAKKTPHFTITKINWLTLFKEIIAFYSENHTKHINKNEELLIVETGGTYIYHWALKGSGFILLRLMDRSILNDAYQLQMLYGAARSYIVNWKG